jgi:hypothetical protein
MSTKTQHCDVYAGATGVAKDKCHYQAAKRLERNGWTSVVHDHRVDEKCNDNCVAYFLKETIDGQV